MVGKALSSGGNYYLLCSHSYTKEEIERIETSIRESLRGAGLEFRDEQILFRDADQLADWVNPLSTDCYMDPGNHATWYRRPFLLLV